MTIKIVAGFQNRTSFWLSYQMPIPVIRVLQNGSFVLTRVFLIRAIKETLLKSESAGSGVIYIDTENILQYQIIKKTL